MSGISYGDGATKRSIGSVFYQDGTTKRTIKNMWIGDGGVNRKVYTAYTPVSASVNPTSVSKSGTGAGTQTVTTSTVTASGANGSGSYTYAWEKVSGTTLTLNNPNGASTWFSYGSLAVNAAVTAVYRCLVSDGTSSAYTPNVSITLTNPKAV